MEPVKALVFLAVMFVAALGVLLLAERISIPEEEYSPETIY